MFFWCNFGVEDSLDMADLFCVVEGGAISLFCVRMYCIFSTLPLDVENTVTRTQSLKMIAFCVLERNREKRTKRVKRAKK